MSCAARSDETRCRHLRGVTERKAFVNANSTQQYPSRHSDRVDSLGYLEEDGVLLAISLLAAIVVLALDLGLVWELLHGEKPTRLLGGIIPVEAPLVSKLVQGPEVN